MSAELKARLLAADDWTDEQIVEFMCVALRHTEYKRGTSGPTINEIRMGLERIGAKPLAAADALPGDDEKSDD